MTTMASEWLKNARTVLIASDPALARLRMASRVTLTLVAVALALAGLHALTPMPVAAYGIALITAMQGALAIRDATASGRAVTRLHAGAAGFLAVSLATLVSPWPLFSEGLFLGLVFVVVYARRYGPRWNAVGMFAFMCYFMGTYLRPAAADLPGVAAAIVLSGLISHLVRNAVLPDHREDDFRRAVFAIERRIGELKQAVAVGRAAAWPDASKRRAIRAQEKVTDAVLIAEGYLPLGAIDESPERQSMADLAIALFDLHLASETSLMTALRHDAATQASPAGLASADAALHRLDAALRAAHGAAMALKPADFSGDTGLTPPPAARSGDGFLGDPALRLAIQVTLATAIAMTGGLLLSKTRWFWATLTAFLVFTNTQSRGDTALRGLDRAAGTLVGIAVGIGLATLLHGQFALSIGLSIVFVFAGFYFLQVSYAAMTFFVTLVVSLLYGLLGQFTPGLLVLRLEETLIGAAAGIFIAFVVFPRSTKRAAGDAVDAFLDALDALLAAATLRIGGRTAPNLVMLSRVLDRRYAELAAVARPLGGNWQLVQRPGPVRQTLLRFMGVAHWSRILARSLSGPAAQDIDAASLAATIGQLRNQIGEARKGGAGLVGLAVPAMAAAARPEPRRADFDTRSDDPQFALDVLAHILDRAAHGGERSGLRTAAPTG